MKLTYWRGILLMAIIITLWLVATFILLDVYVLYVGFFIMMIIATVIGLKIEVD